MKFVIWNEKKLNAVVIFMFHYDPIICLEVHIAKYLWSLLLVGHT
jgi:hypothetical protein